MEIKGRHFAITGANRGIGRAIAVALAKRGAHLHLVHRKVSLSGLEDLVSLGAASAQEWICDFAEPKSIDDLIERWSKSHVQMDVLINNAGLLTGGLLENQPLEDIYKMIQVNLLATIHLSRKLLPGFLQRKSGLIVNNASVSGRMFLPCASTYAASKAAVVAFTECLRQELKGTGVSTLLLLTPGVKTDMYSQIDDLYGSNYKMDFLSDGIAAERWASSVCEAIEKGKSECLPPPSSRLLVSFAHHFPKTFGQIIRTQFHR